MTIMQNEFVGRPERIFICYHEVIRNPYPYILKKMRDQFRPYYEPFLDFSVIDGMDDDNLLRYCVGREDYNVLQDLLKVDNFDSEGALDDVGKRYVDLYESSDLLPIGRSMRQVMHEKFTEKIYIYTRHYDPRVHADIQELFGNMEKVNYVCGPFMEVIEKLEGITSYFLDKIDYFEDIFFLEKGSYTTIGVGQFGYNYYMDEEDPENPSLELRVNLSEYLVNEVCQFATFAPVDFEERHFTDVRLREN